MALRYLLAFAYNATGQFESAIWVLGSTGLPDSVINGGAQLGNEWEGYMVLVNAVFGAGELQIADELAEFWFSHPFSHNRDWFQFTYTACALAVLGRDDEALQDLQSSMISSRLARDSILRDSTCFQGYADEHIYQAVLQHFDEQRSKIRARLPQTLAEFGVTLFPGQSAEK